MLIFLYKSKKELRENIGKPLRFQETSFFGPEYSENAKNLTGSNRPTITGIKGREFFANVSLENGLIKSVS